MVLTNCSPSYGPHFTTTGSSIQTNEPVEVEEEVVTVYEEVVVEESVVSEPSFNEVEVIEPVEVVGGHMTPPDRPGHGMQFRPELFSEFPIGNQNLMGQFEDKFSKGRLSQKNRRIPCLVFNF